MIEKKHFLWGAGVAGVIAGGAYLYRVSRLSAQLETVTEAMIHEFSLSGMLLKVNVTLKNPTEGTVKVKFPFVKMIYGNTTIASSEVKNQDFQLSKFGQTKLEPLFILISFATLGMQAPAALTEYRKQGKITVQVKTISTINGKLPYEKLENMTIGKEKAG